MARPKKQTVDYFPHMCSHKKTIYILEQKYGNNGYAFWFKLLEMLGSTEGHCLNLNNDTTWEFLQAKTHIEADLCTEMLNLLAKLEAIDPELWEEKVIWSQNFVDGILDVYKNRRVDMPVKPDNYRQKPRQLIVSTDENPQSKVKESKGKNIMFFLDVINYLNDKAGTGYKPDSKATMQYINARLSEGYTLDDFKKVIDKKCAEWKGTDQEKYLRPETLFGTKFEGYLNQKLTPKSKPPTKARAPSETPSAASVLNGGNYVIYNPDD